MDIVGHLDLAHAVLREECLDTMDMLTGVSVRVNQDWRDAFQLILLHLLVIVRLLSLALFSSLSHVEHAQGQTHLVY